MSILQGGCACGSVRYSVNAEPLFSVHCYCRECQRITGAGHASQFGVLAEAVTLRGGIRSYFPTPDGGSRVTSGFCPTCGSPILKKSAGFPHMIFFHTAALDDPASFKPRNILRLGSRQPWDPIDPSLADG